MDVISIRRSSGLIFSIANYAKFFHITKFFTIKLAYKAKSMPEQVIIQLSFFKKYINRTCLGLKENY
jgi:hypothetical protein